MARSPTSNVVIGNLVVTYIFHRGIGVVLLPSDSPLLHRFNVEVHRNSDDYLPEDVKFVSRSLTIQGPLNTELTMLLRGLC